VGGGGVFFWVWSPLRVGEVYREGGGVKKVTGLG